MIGDGRNTYADSTLQGMKKDELIDIIRCLEGNLQGANETLDIQSDNVKKLLGSAEEELVKYKAALFSIARADIMLDFLKKYGNKTNALQALDVAAVHTMAIYFRDLELNNLYESYQEALEEVRNHEGKGWKEVDGIL